MKQLAALMGGMMKLNGASVVLMKTVNFRLSFRFLYVDGSLRVSKNGGSKLILFVLVCCIIVFAASHFPRRWVEAS